ncbi:hypothetical protein [Methyloferula stellata]|uniref:hypothetical protein n=1 Tax=Methyloferula stellata TaxID=876270 RepID=UPI000479B59E|nr:hypothetical protein [Methyloferula stellata]
MRQMARALAFAAMLGSTVAPLSAAFGQVPDVTLVPGAFVPPDGAPCVFEDWGPTISLPWPSIWLGHFAGGRFVNTAYGRTLDWYDEKVCFPSRAACNRWISGQRRALHHPEGDWTCLPIR